MPHLPVTPTVDGKIPVVPRPPLKPAIDNKTPVIPQPPVKSEVDPKTPIVPQPEVTPDVLPAPETDLTAPGPAEDRSNEVFNRRSRNRFDNDWRVDTGRRTKA